MRKKTLFVAGATTLTGVAALILNGNYQRWKRGELTRIQAEDYLAATVSGPVEYGIQGKGPAVLMVHGSPGGYDMGLALARWINCSGFTYIAPSRPGYLRTPLSSGVSPEAQADLYAGLLDTLNIDRVVVMAVSGGGPSALQFALRHPARCRGLVLLCVVARRYVEGEFYRQFPLNTRVRKKLTNRLLLSDPFIYALRTLASFQPDSISGGDEFLSTLSLAYLRKEGYRNDMRQFAAMMPYPLEQIALPTLIAQGTADTEVSFSDAQFLASSIPNAQLVPVAGADHLFFLTHQQEVLPRLREFLHSLQ